MRKLRHDSKWSGLPADTKRQVVKWLFEDNLSYRLILERAGKEFGIHSSITSLGRYHKHLRKAREAAGVNLPDVSPEEFRTATQKLLGMAAIRAGFADECDNVSQQFIPLIKLMMEQDDLELKAKKLKLELERIGATISSVLPKNR